MRADCGAVGFVPKPFDLGELARFLRGQDGRGGGRRPFVAGPRRPRSALRRPLTKRRADARRRVRLRASPGAHRPATRRGARARAPARARRGARPRSSTDASRELPDVLLAAGRARRRQRHPRHPGAPPRPQARTGGRVEVLLVRRIGPRELEVGRRRAPRRRGVARAGQGQQAAQVRCRRRDARARRGPEACPARGSPARTLPRTTGCSRSPSGRPTRPSRSTPAVRAAGHVPLPPYIKRDDEADDAERYQTVYARTTAPSPRRPPGCT